jgi:hypothetical protein
MVRRISASRARRLKRRLSPLRDTFVTIFDEPLLERRRPGESWDNFKDRFAEGLHLVATYDTRAALVVCDELPDSWATPLVLDCDGIVARAGVLENEVPLP